LLLLPLQLLHTLSMNGGQVLLDAMAASKVMKYLERALNKPTIPGLDVAAAQLLLDWTYLLGWAPTSALSAWQQGSMTSTVGVACPIQPCWFILTVL
jgi:hypothetical protein